MTKPLVIYHANCWDGFCAAWIAWRVHNTEVDLYAAHYGQSPPDVKGRHVYIVDFSYKRPVMEQILRDAQSVVVLDHHKTAEAELEGLDGCVFDMQRSGGRLTWEWFYPDLSSSWLVDYTEDRDLWRWKLPNSRAVSAALRSYPLDLQQWEGFSHLRPNDFVREGEAILRSEAQLINQHTRNAREITVAGHKILAVNATVLFSDIAGELAKGRPFGACWFDRQDGKRQWSLRSREDGVDVSEIAKRYGGGGHAQAAGFEQTIAHVENF